MTIEIDVENWEPDEFGEKPLSDFIQELQEILDACGNDATISFWQFGDRWDGYGCANLTIRRPETEEEERERKATALRRELERVEQEAQRRAELYQVLKAEFEL